MSKVGRIVAVRLRLFGNHTCSCPWRITKISSWWPKSRSQRLLLRGARQFLTHHWQIYIDKRLIFGLDTLLQRFFLTPALFRWNQNILALFVPQVNRDSKNAKIQGRTSAVRTSYHKVLFRSQTSPSSDVVSSHFWPRRQEPWSRLAVEDSHGAERKRRDCRDCFRIVNLYTNWKLAFCDPITDNRSLVFVWRIEPTLAKVTTNLLVIGSMGCPTIWSSPKSEMELFAVLIGCNSDENSYAFCLHS